MKKSELKSLIRECVSELGGLITNRVIMIPETPFNTKELKESPIPPPPQGSLAPGALDKNHNRFSGKMIYKSEHTLVLRPLNHMDMTMISGGTKWPAGHFKGGRLFNQYLHRGKIFFILDNSKIPIRKWALFVPQKNEILPDHITRWQIFDKDDKEVDVESVLTMLNLNKNLFEKP